MRVNSLWDHKDEIDRYPLQSPYPSNTPLKHHQLLRHLSKSHLLNLIIISSPRHRGWHQALNVLLLHICHCHHLLLPCQSFVWNDLIWHPSFGNSPHQFRAHASTEEWSCGRGNIQFQYNWIYSTMSPTFGPLFFIFLLLLLLFMTIILNRNLEEEGKRGDRVQQHFMSLYFISLGLYILLLSLSCDCIPPPPLAILKHNLPLRVIKRPLSALLLQPTVSPNI